MDNVAETLTAKVIEYATVVNVIAQDLMEDLTVDLEIQTEDLVVDPGDLEIVMEDLVVPKLFMQDVVKARKFIFKYLGRMESWPAELKLLTVKY